MGEKKVKMEAEKKAHSHSLKNQMLKISNHNN